MSHPQPIRQARFGGLLVQGAACVGNPGLRASQSDNEIHLRAAVDDEADTAKHSVDFSECSEPVQINSRQRGCLNQQLFVCHEFPPASVRGQPTTVVYRTQFYFGDNDAFRANVAAQPQIESIVPFVPRSGTGIGCGFRQRNHKRLDHVRKFRQRQRQSRHDNANGILSAEQHNPNDAFNNSDFVNAVEENLGHVMRVDHFHYLSPVFVDDATLNEKPASAIAPQHQPRAEAGTNFLSSQQIEGTAVTPEVSTGNSVTADNSWPDDPDHQTEQSDNRQHVEPVNHSEAF